MKRVQYSEKPNIFEFFKNGEVTYRWDILEEEIIDDFSKINRLEWICCETTINQPISKEQLTKAVITTIWDNEFEKKLINDYNGASNNLFDSETNLKYIQAYNDFLIQRKNIKEQINIDWNNNI